MVVLHYAYLKLKMPGNNGTNITVHRSFSRSHNCDREFQKIAAKFGIKQEVKTINFPSKQLASRDKDSRLKEDDSAKNTKKQPDDPATAVPTITPSAVDDKVSVEGANFLAIIASAPKEAIITIPDIIGTSSVNQEKKDPPLI
jgi:hypothetical protein